MADDTPTIDPILKEAKERFRRCENWESYARTRYREDLEFEAGDSDNGFQWPNQIRKQYEANQRPYLTINKVRQHVLQITNDARQNTPGVTVDPVGDGATYEAAQTFEGVIRHVEYQSNAQVAYDTATLFQVKCGIGYWRVVTDYAGPDTFDQEIFIRRIKDPTSVYLDPDIQEFDGSDARFAFIFEDMPRELFEKEYPDFKEQYGGAGSVLGEGSLNDTTSWCTDDYVRRAEYFTKADKKDWLISYVQDGERKTIYASKVGKEVVKGLLEDPETRKREVLCETITWRLIVAGEILEEKEWLGKYIPIVRVIGEEHVINGVLDRAGHVRYLKDPQRMYNYWTSAATESVALQSKTPYIGTTQAIEGLENYWEAANQQNFSILPYNGVDDQGNAIPPPQRAAPPVMPQAYIQGMQVAQNEMMMVSGQYEAMMGAQGNERSGKAINERQRQGDRATYHYIDNLAIAIAFTGKIILDLIPKIYDTPRVLRILGKDGEAQSVQLDPRAKQAFMLDQQRAAKIFNPNVGKYSVQANVGPAYATQRQEAFNAFTQIIAQNPALTSVIGDILLKAGDFPMADEAAERLKRLVPPQALGEGPSAGEQQLGQQLQAASGQLQSMQQLMQTLLEELAEERLKNQRLVAKADVDVYNAQTKRIDVVGKLQTEEVKAKTAAAEKAFEAIDKARQVQTDIRQLPLPLGPVVPKTKNRLTGTLRLPPRQNALM